MDGPGRYRRAFDWRLNREDSDDLATAAGALGDLFSSEMPEILEDYLGISRKRRKNRLALAKLQTHLIDDLVNIESAVKHHRKDLQSIGTIVADDPDLESKKRRVKFNKRELFWWRAFANVIRSIADGVAWRALGFDRAVLRALCQNRGSQQLTTEGTVEELREWSRQFDHGSGIAILNSLTNWLTYGDVTVVRNDGTVEIIEVKSSKTTSNRVVRQKQKMRELVTLLSTGKGSLEGKTVEVCTLDIVPENGLDVLAGLLKQTDKPPGFACHRLSNSTYVECIDLRVIQEGGEVQLTKQRESLIADWHARDDDVHSSESLKCLGFSPNLAPFSIFPFEPKACVELLTGAKAYMVLLNVTGVAREFEYRGWQVLSTPKQVFEAGRMEEDFMTVKKEGFHVTLPPAAFMRMQMELLQPHVLIKQCELIRQAGPGAFDFEFNLPIYEHEADVWC